MRKSKSTGSTYYWFQRFNLNFTDLLDPIGWTGNVSIAYVEQITEDEFIKRLRISKVDVKIQFFLKGYKRLWKIEKGKRG